MFKPLVDYISKVDEIRKFVPHTLSGDNARLVAMQRISDFCSVSKVLDDDGISLLLGIMKEAVAPKSPLIVVLSSISVAVKIRAQKRTMVLPPGTVKIRAQKRTMVLPPGTDFPYMRIIPFHRLVGVEGHWVLAVLHSLSLTNHVLYYYDSIVDIGMARALSIRKDILSILPMGDTVELKTIPVPPQLGGYECGGHVVLFAYLTMHNKGPLVENNALLAQTTSAAVLKFMVFVHAWVRRVVGIVDGA